MRPVPRTDPACRVAAPEAFSLPGAALHEFHAASCADGAALSALPLMLAGMAGRPGGLWIRGDMQDRETGFPCPDGLAELGLDPASLLLLRVRDTASALQAALEGARCPGLPAVFLELWGEARGYDLTASRRLLMASRNAGVTIFVNRHAGKPAPSAAVTRWEFRALPSRPLPAGAPGHPAFALTLLRARNGQQGLRYHLEWFSDERRLAIHEPGFSESGSLLPSPAPLPGLVVSLPVDRSRPPPPPVWREAG